MKGLPPTELVEISRQVVIVFDERPVVLFSTLHAGIMNPRVLIDHGLDFIRSQVRE